MLNMKNCISYTELVYIAKICLNSLWIKFGLNSYYFQCDYINDYNKFISISLNDKVDDLIIKQFNEKLLCCSYTISDNEFGAYY